MLLRFLDIVHTSLIWGALFQYLIFDFGDVSKIDFITWCVLDQILTVSLSYKHSLRYPGTLRYGPTFESVEAESSFNHIPADSSVYGTFLFAKPRRFRHPLNHWHVYRQCLRSLYIGPSFVTYLFLVTYPFCGWQFPCASDLDV
jgi:hypothetical protein